MVSTRSRSNSIAVDNFVTTTTDSVATAVSAGANVESITGRSDDDHVGTSNSRTDKNDAHPATKKSSRKADQKKEPLESSTKQQQQQLLRMKNTGRGIQINIHSDSTENNSSSTATASVTAATATATSKSINRKIVFAEEDDVINPDDDNSDNIVDRVYDALQANQKAHTDDDNEEDDNDIVEEVKGVTAKDQLFMDLQQQRMALTNTKKKKKNRNNQKRSLSAVSVQKSQMGDDDDEILDETFFQQLEQDHKNEKQQQRKKKKSGEHDTTVPVSKHTTFVVVDDNDDDDEHCILEEEKDGIAATIPEPERLSIIKHTNPNTVVVVLNDSIYTNNSNSSNESSYPNDHWNDKVSYYSRLGCIEPRLPATTSINVRKQNGAKNNNPRAPSSTNTTTSWTRSNKMNRILSVPSHVRRHGKAAIQFTTTHKQR